MAHLLQIGKHLDNHTIGLLEALHTARFCSAASAPHVKPWHDTFPNCENYQFPRRIAPSASRREEWRWCAGCDLDRLPCC
jgi:hypothetical protein